MTDLGSSLTSDEANKSKRRSRTCFTKRQLEELEGVYQTNQYPDSYTRKRIVETLNISDAIVQIWFKNRRAKDRKSTKLQNEAHRQNVYGYSPIMAVPQNPASHPYRTSSCQNLRPIPYFTRDSNGSLLYYNGFGYYSPYPESGEVVYSASPQQQYYVTKNSLDNSGYYSYQSSSHHGTQSCPSIDSSNIRPGYLGIEDKENAP